MRKVKGKLRQYSDNPIEKNSENWDEILGLITRKGEQKQAGELFEGQELNLKELQRKNVDTQEEKKEKAYVDPGIDYSREIIRVEEKVSSREKQELDMQLKEIMIEIKKLADSSKELQVHFKAVAVEQHTKAPGKYHKNFFSWLLSIVRAARMKVEDSSAWLQAMHSKKKSRKYGAMSKKYGTSFSLSNERNVSTQVG